MGILTLFILIATNAWDGSSSVSFVVLAGLAGFAAYSVASIRGYYKDWYRPVAISGTVLLGISAYYWLIGRDQLPGVCMIVVVILVIIDLCRNH